MSSSSNQSGSGSPDTNVASRGGSGAAGLISHPVGICGSDNAGTSHQTGLGGPQSQSGSDANISRATNLGSSSNDSGSRGLSGNTGDPESTNHGDTSSDSANNNSKR